MEKLYLRICWRILLTFFSIICFTISDFIVVVHAASNFNIYPTQNYFTQIELDTRNGKIWQVHTAVGKDGVIQKIPLNLAPMTDLPEPGRFILSPTGNMYNFVLLDTIDGRTWQIQWSYDKTKRGIIAPIE